MLDQHFKIRVNVGVMNWLIEILVNSGQLRDQGQCVHYKLWLVVSGHQLILGYSSEATTLNELISEIFRALCCEH